MWVRNAWYVAAWSHELEAGALMSITIIEQPLVLYRTEAGTVVTMEDRCCHRLAPLSKGRLEGDDLRCMYHGMKFAPDGRCVEIPGQATIPEKARVYTYPTVERGAWVWVWMGDADAADPDLIPQTTAADDPALRQRRGQLDFDAHYLLIDDNLLDLSHLSYVHEHTLGRDTPQWADERPTIRKLERGLRVQRWIENKVPNAHLRQHGERLDMWTAYDFTFPGVFALRSGWYEAGTAARVDHGEPTETPFFWRVDDQAVTPMTARTSRYFYAAGVRREDLAWPLIDKMFAITQAAFHEDKAIIEAQQRVIDLDPAREMVATNFDGGPIQYRRLVDRLLADEAERRTA